MNSVTRRSAALPPDVRKVSDLPYCHLNYFGAPPQIRVEAPDLVVGIPVRQSLTAHQAAQPRS
jgi:hypothetical protein